MSPLYIFGQAPKAAIRLETAKNNPIDNYQVFELSSFERNQFQDFTAARYASMKIRTAPSPQYNCHGMSFACRRTNIDSSTEIRKILADDGYRLQAAPALPGDLLLYVTSAGDISHSGTVVGAEYPPNDLPRILVVSKWGKFCEVIHLHTDCPYMEVGLQLEFHRLNHDY